LNDALPPDAQAPERANAELRRLKQQLRREARRRRDRQPDRERLSHIICGRLMALPEFQRAGCVMSYVDFSSEVRTRPLLRHLLEAGRLVVVPYCSGGELGLFRLERLDELAPSRFGIPEPPVQLRSQPERQIEPGQIDLVVVPGLVFDRRGGRIGFGRGYYDRLLGRLRPQALRIALAFECQMVEQVPMLPHDVPVHMIVTQKTVYRCSAGK